MVKVWIVKWGLTECVWENEDYAREEFDSFHEDGHTDVELIEAEMTREQLDAMEEFQGW